MPYADHEKQLEAMREWRRRRKRERVGIPAAAPAIATPRPLSPARPPREPAAGSSPRRELLRDYQRQREAGHGDATAQAIALQNRDGRRERAALDRQEREIESHARQYLDEARRRLSACGFYNEADVWPAAMQLARQEQRQRQAPRQGDTLAGLLAPGRRGGFLGLLGSGRRLHGQAEEGEG